MLPEDIIYTQKLPDVDPAGSAANLALKTFPLTIFGLEIEPAYWQAAVIVILLFLLVFTLARVRYLYVHWSLGSSAWAMLLWGFLLALILEGLILVSGKTILMNVLGWRNPPQPIDSLLETGRAQFIKVLGAEDEVKIRGTPKPTYQSVVKDFRDLSDFDRKKAKAFICEP
ncbi:MAG: hypothetical protein NZM26_01640 [Patescibacteria group bacterium]|nr:hypothetical protein [Patescibacteria group bacterium]